MFWKKDTEAPGLRAEIATLKDERRKLKQEVEDLKLQKKMDEEDIKHMVRIKEERAEVESEKARVKMEGEKQEAIAKVRDDYRIKTEEYLNTQVKRMETMYADLLKRLPDVNVALKGNLGGS